jgi:hypothetical protein
VQVKSKCFRVVVFAKAYERFLIIKSGIAIPLDVELLAQSSNINFFKFVYLITEAK